MSNADHDWKLCRDGANFLFVPLLPTSRLPNISAFITFINLSERTEGMLKLCSPYYTMINLFNCSCLQLISIHSAYAVNLMYISLCWVIYTKQQKTKKRVFSFLWTLWTFFDLIEMCQHISVFFSIISLFMTWGLIYMDCMKMYLTANNYLLQHVEMVMVSWTETHVTISGCVL